jgi:hypothetical protein
MALEELMKESPSIVYSASTKTSLQLGMMTV